MSTDPSVSVVMAVFDGEAHLVEAVESVLGQSFGDLELVVVDDGSRDATPEILRRYAASDPRVRIHTQENAGLVPSLNRGCGLARGRYLARMDADDVCFPERLERQVAFLEEHPDTALLGTAYVLIDEAGAPNITIYKPTDRAGIAASFARYANPFLHPSVVMRREVFEGLGGYRSAFLHAEDYELWLRIAERHETANLPEPLLWYRMHHEQVSHVHLEQGIVSVLGSHAATRSRREAGREPSWSGPHVTREDLRTLGVADAALEGALAEGCFWQGNLMTLCGYGETARSLFEGALDHAGASGLRRRLGRRILDAYVPAPRDGIGRLARNRLDLMLLMLAGCIRPRLADTLLRGKVERIMRDQGVVGKST